MERRGVRTARLSVGCLDRLRLALTKSSGEAPTEFHFFTRAAPGFTDEQMTRVFAALHDDAPGFAKFVRSRVRISRKKKVEVGEEAAAGAPASRDLAGEYELRYIAHMAAPRGGGLNIEMAEGGCSMQTLFDGEKGVNCSQGGAATVAAGAPFQAVGAAAPETSAPRDDQPGAVDVSGSSGARFIGGADR